MEEKQIWEYEADARRRETERKLAQRNNLLDQLQTGLDVAGMTPGAGMPFDLVNAVISGGRGKWGDLGLNLASAVPGLGLSAGLAKMVKRGELLKKKGLTEVKDSAGNIIGYSKYDPQGVVGIKTQKDLDNLDAIYDEAIFAENMTAHRGQLPYEYIEDEYIKYLKAKKAKKSPPKIMKMKKKKYGGLINDSKVFSYLKNV